jgi:multicomponent Na+:H+ antiporter subunit C
MELMATGFVEEHILPHFNYWIYVILMMIGLWAMISKNNLIKKLIGMSIFQTAIILFWVSIGVKDGANIPILDHDTYVAEKAAGRPAEGVPARIEKDNYANPLPHVLMLTAIVVGVSTLGLALAISQRIYGAFGTLEEDEILDELRPGGHD